MKRYASHYLFVPGSGYLKQHVIEVEDGYVRRMFPLTEEIEDVEWLPGVIELQLELIQEEEQWVPYLLFPFDFTSMQPVAGTQRKQLR